MSDGTEQQWLADLAGNPRVFEKLYTLHDATLRMAAWRICRRGDWIDDMVNETWRRGFEARASYDPGRPFLVWLTGILRNVFREQQRQRPDQAVPDAGLEEIDALEPTEIAAEAEMLLALHDCVAALSADDRELVQLRFFENAPLRLVAERLKVPEATLRETRIPAVLNRLRICLKHKGLDISQIFSAHGGLQIQWRGGERE